MGLAKVATSLELDTAVSGFCQTKASIADE